MTSYTSGSVVASKITLTGSLTTFEQIYLQECIIEASALLDTEFALRGLTVDTGSADQALVPYIAADIAASLAWERYIPYGFKLSGKFNLDTDANAKRFWNYGYTKLNALFENLVKPTFYFIESSGSAYTFSSGSG